MKLIDKAIFSSKTVDLIIPSTRMRHFSSLELFFAFKMMLDKFLNSTDKPLALDSRLSFEVNLVIK